MYLQNIPKSGDEFIQKVKDMQRREMAVKAFTAPNHYAKAFFLDGAESFESNCKVLFDKSMRYAIFVCQLKLMNPYLPIPYRLEN